MTEYPIGCYFNYRSNASLFRAMYVNIGEYKLFFSFKHLICLKKGEDLYITKEKFNYTGKHRKYIKNSAYYDRNIHEIEQAELELMLFKDLLKIPYIGRLNFDSYHYDSNNSKYKAMRLEMGNFKLYYSYNTLIAFETLKNQYVSNLPYSHTTRGHKYSTRNFGKDRHSVSEKVLKLVAITNLLKLPFEEAKEIARISCERVY